MFSDAPQTDPVLADIGEAAAWRGVLLRNYSVSAWRRLWAALVRSIGQEDDSADRSAEDLQAWLAGQMPDTTVRAFMAELPPGMTGRHPAPAEWTVLADGSTGDPQPTSGSWSWPGARPSWTARRARCSSGRQNEIFNPLWMDRCVREFLDRPLRDLAVRLVNDMLAQARRVALAKCGQTRAVG